jgi:hypothetical protein
VKSDGLEELFHPFGQELNKKAGIDKGVCLDNALLKNVIYLTINASG